MTDETPTPTDGGDDLIDAFKLTRYRKAITAAALGLIAWGTQVVLSAPAGVTAAEWVGLGGVAVVTLGVERVTNAS